MLTEKFLAATSAPPKLNQANSSVVKDAGIFIHSLQPSAGLLQTFKKSVTSPNCLAFNKDHIFAAQLGKATVHVYSRSKSNQESTVAFTERIRSTTLAARGTILVLGTETGSLLVWELATGRQLTTAAAHLQPVTCLAVDEHNGFLMSGSDDSVIHVWSCLDLFTFHNSFETSNYQRTPRHSFSAHRKAITGIVVGRTGHGLNLTASSSEDKSVLLWNHQTGTQLMTYLLDSIPRSLAIDPADRALLVGLDDGSLQLIEFHPPQETSFRSQTYDDNTGVATFNHMSAGRWAAPSTDIGSITTVSISFDGSTALTGHTSGKIVPWNIATGQSGAPLASYDEAPITSVEFLSPGELVRPDQCCFTIPSVVRPKPYEDFSSAHGKLTGNYDMHIQLLDCGSVDEPSELQCSFDDNGVSSSFADLLASGKWLSDTGTARLPNSDTSADFMSLEGSFETELGQKHYQDQIEHLKKMQRLSNRRHQEQQLEIRELQRALSSAKR